MPTFLERLRRDRAQVRLERLERLQALTEELSAAQTREAVVRVIFERGLGLVDASAVAVYWERVPGELELVHALGVSDEFVHGRRRLAADERDACAEAFRSGRPVWVAGPDELRARFPASAEVVGGGRSRAYAAIPLASGAGRGALGLQFPELRAFDDEERSFVLAVARQCTQAVERARLFDQANRIAERLQQLQTASSALSTAGSPREIAAAAFRGLGALGACAVEVHGVEPAERVALLARYGRGGGQGEGAVPIDAPTPASDVVRTGRAIWLEAPAEIADRYPGLAAIRAERDEGAWVAVPLLASGKAVGALVATFPSERTLAADDRTFVRLVAQPCAQALDRHRLFEEAARARIEAERTAALIGGMCDAAPVGLALLDREMRFVQVNDVFARTDGIARDAHVGRTPAELLPGAPEREMQAAFRSALAGRGPVEQQLVGESPAHPGVRHRYATQWYPVRLRGEVVGVGVVVRELR